MFGWGKKNKSKTLVEEKVEPVPGYFDVKLAIVEDGRVKIELDWDDVFIKEMRKRGYEGTEDQIAQQALVYFGGKVANDELAEDFNEDSDYT